MKNFQIKDNDPEKQDLEKYPSHTEIRHTKKKEKYQKKIWLKYVCRNCGHESHKHKSVPDGHNQAAACVECKGKTLRQEMVAEAEIHEN